MNRYIMRMLSLKKQGCATEEDKRDKGREETSFAEELMDSVEFKNYIGHNGYHFSDKLADWASSRLTNKDQSKHRWTAENIKYQVLQQMSESIKHGSWGDLAYSANKAYAAYYPSLLRDEAACVKFAIITDLDSNNRSSSVFNHYLSDVIEKKEDVPWGEVI